MWFRVGRRSRRTFSTDFDICDFCRQRVGIFSHIFIRPPCVADTDIIFLPCGFFYLSSSFLHTATINYDAVETSSKNLKVSRKSSTQSTSDSNFTHIVSFISFGIAVNTSWHIFADLRSFGDENYENPLTAAVQRGWMLLWVEWLSCGCCWRWCKVQMNRAVSVCIPRRLRQCGASHVYDIKLLRRILARYRAVVIVLVVWWNSAHCPLSLYVARSSPPPILVSSYQLHADKK